MYLIFHGPLFFPPRRVPPYCRSERNTGNKNTQQSWAQQGNLLCTSSSWHYRIAVRTQSWASSFRPLYMFLVAFFLALRERSGRRQPPAERSPCIYYDICKRFPTAGNERGDTILGSEMLDGHPSKTKTKNPWYCRERVRGARDISENWRRLLGFGITPQMYIREQVNAWAMTWFSYVCTTTSTKGISKAVFDNVPQSAPPPPSNHNHTTTFHTHICIAPPSLLPTGVMSALSRHSPAKCKNPDNHECRTVGASRRPQTVGNPEWACPNHAVCSGFIATRLRNDGKTHFKHCDQQIYKDAQVVWGLSSAESGAVRDNGTISYRSKEYFVTLCEARLSLFSRLTYGPCTTICPFTFCAITFFL